MTFILSDIKFSGVGDSHDSYYSAKVQDGSKQYKVKYLEKKGENKKEVQKNVEAQLPSLISIGEILGVGLKNGPQAIKINLETREIKLITEKKKEQSLNENFKMRVREVKNKDEIVSLVYQFKSVKNAVKSIQKKFQNGTGVPRGLKKVDFEIDKGYKNLKDEWRGIEPKKTGYNDEKLFDENHIYYHAAKQLLMLMKQDPTLDKKLKEEIREEPADNSEKIKNILRESILQLHYIKLTHSTPFTLGKLKHVSTVSTEFRRAYNMMKKTISKFLAPIGALFYLVWKREKIRDVNLSAVKETLANEIYNILGFGGANVQIIETKYKDTNIPRLLVRSKEVRGPHGEKAQSFPKSLHKVKSKNARLNANTVKTADKKEIHVNTKSLARGLAPALFLGDNDKWGPWGDNILFYESAEDGEAHLLNVDPGKSLPEADKKTTYRLEFEGIHSNLTFDQPVIKPVDKYTNVYSNFTLFQDTRLSEKMEGVKAILDKDNWKKIEDTFKAYIKKYSRKEEGLDFSEALTELLKDLRKRREYFRKVFKDRYKLSAQQLDLVDNLEKLTSKTRQEVSKVKLQHLEVLPESRREWNYIKNDYLVYKCKSKADFIQVSKTLADFLQGDSYLIEYGKNTIRIKVEDDLFDKFEEEKIISFKK